MPRSRSVTRKVSNTLLKLYLTEKDLVAREMTRITWVLLGATNEVATLKEAVSAAERNAAVERTG